MTIRIVPAEPEIEYSEEYSESLAKSMGEERAAWARLPREELEKELRWYHDNFNCLDFALMPQVMTSAGYLRICSSTVAR